MIFLDEEGAPASWLLLDPGQVILRGEAGEPLPTPATAILAVPGEKVAIHWLDLAEGLAPAQAAAAARLLLADSSAEPIADLHVAVGPAEQGRTPVAMVPSRQMAEWLGAAAAAGIDPALIVPTPMLLGPSPHFILRRDRGALADYRGEALAFSLEPALAEKLLGDSETVNVSPERFESDLPSILAGPLLNLRQGPFARRRDWRIDGGRLRRIAGFVLAFVLLAADSFEAEARSLSDSGRASRSGDFGAVAAGLFEAVRATPNVELTRIDYRADGSLTAGLQADSPASLAALEERARAAGLDAQVGPPRNAGGRTAADLTVRP